MIETRFKDTEVGRIPENWNIIPIRKLATDMADGPFGSNLKTEHYTTDKQVRIIQLGNIGDCGWLDENTKYTTFEHAKTLSRCIATPGCILVAKMMPAGRSIVCPSKEKQYILGSDVVRIVPNEKLIAEYFVYQSKSEIYLSQIAANTQGSTRQRTSISKLRDICIPIPVEKSEQTRIASALSNIDALISELGKLIEKKRAIKQGAMQQLLTGKKRLKGFATSTKFKQTEIGLIPENWNVSPIGELCNLKARIGWQGLTTNEYLSQGDYILITGIDFKDGYIDWDNCCYVSKWRYDQDTNIQIKEGDVLISKDGTIGKVAYLKNIPKAGTLNSGVFVVRPKNDDTITQPFLSWLFKSIWFNDFINQLTAGSTINHLYQKDFVKFQLVYPEDKKEQSAIASVLTSMDDEISALESKKTKYEQIKQGMMQQLLTGKIRLID